MKFLINLLFFIALFFYQNVYASEHDSALSQAEVRQSIVDTLKVLNEVYVFPEKAKMIESEILARMNKGSYDHIKSAKEFEAYISDELKEVSTDSHLSIMMVKDEDKEPTHVLVETEDEYKYNYAFQKLEILTGNVGYIKFNKFYQDEEALETVNHAFGFLKDTKAMIIDLRDCIGGSPELVQYIMSQFFDDRTVLWQTHTRNNEKVYDYLSSPDVGYSNFKKQYPLYILVGSRTASAAEIFAYTLKHFNKATLIGEITRGAAHGVGAVKINQYFVGRFSMSRPVNPITHTNWEVVGVIPHIKSSYHDSLKVAHNIALESID